MAEKKTSAAKSKEKAPAKEKEPEFTYARAPETPEQAARITDILAHWEDTQKFRPLPLEWLVDSLKAGLSLPPPWEE